MHMFENMSFKTCPVMAWPLYHCNMIASVDLLPEMVSIDMLTALKLFLGHSREHVLRLLRLYGDQA